MPSPIVTPFSMRLDPQVRARLEEEARRSQRSASFVATQAIEAFLEALAVKRKAIEAAVIEADKGVFVSSEAVSAWMDSWGSDAPLAPPTPNIRPRSRRK